MGQRRACPAAGNSATPFGCGSANRPVCGTAKARRRNRARKCASAKREAGCGWTLELQCEGRAVVLRYSTGPRAMHFVASTGRASDEHKCADADNAHTPTCTTHYGARAGFGWTRGRCILTGRSSRRCGSLVAQVLGCNGPRTELARSQRAVVPGDRGEGALR